jgi:hypothetical protein
VRFRRRPSVVQVDLVLGLALVSLAVSLWLIGDSSAREAVAKFGHNVDSGAYEQTFALFIVLPAAILLLLAARLNAAKSTLGSVLHSLGVKLAMIVAAIVALFTLVS